MKTKSTIPVSDIFDVLRNTVQVKSLKQNGNLVIRLHDCSAVANQMSLLEKCVHELEQLSSVNMTLDMPTVNWLLHLFFLYDRLL